MFFGKFDKIQYHGKTVTNITNSILLKYRPMNNTTLYTFHSLVEGETAEILAHKYYDRADDHWIILLLNNIVDPYFGWLLTSREISAMVEQKYGEGKGNLVHHLTNLTTRKRLDEVEQSKYVNREGYVILPLPAHYHPVTNHEFETEKNELKRDIKILAPRYVQDFKNQFEDIMAGVDK